MDDFLNIFCLTTFLFVCYLINDLSKIESAQEVFNEYLTEEEFIYEIYYDEESVVNKTKATVNETSIAVNEPNDNNNFQNHQSEVENKLLSNFSSKETNDDKWKILEFKFANMTCEEKFDKRGLILRLDIKRLIEILEKIEPNLVNSWLQNFIDSIDINENDSFYNTKLRIKQLEYIIYNELIPNLIIKCIMGAIVCT
ncbi:13030_t:CDS:1 [Dentiscutata heterogama]|uniref:13030_t:CDS:1 n=1 Tax=Dentiscutata heterogama TaxID=1316150 RepID=A0ACA9LUQ9_9GLOM|nr:13030_t:CDS:1 [Dentiscutata heterogama]